MADSFFLSSLGQCTHPETTKHWRCLYQQGCWNRSHSIKKWDLFDTQKKCSRSSEGGGFVLTSWSWRRRRPHWVQQRVSITPSHRWGTSPALHLMSGNSQGSNYSGGHGQALAFLGKTAETNHSSSEGQKSRKSRSILQQTARCFCRKITYKQCGSDLLTALCTGRPRKDLADYSLRCTVNFPLHFMQMFFLTEY